MKILLTLARGHIGGETNVIFEQIISLYETWPDNTTSIFAKRLGQSSALYYRVRHTSTEITNMIQAELQKNMVELPL
jgi:hypothetical protein